MTMPNNIISVLLQWKTCIANMYMELNTEQYYLRNQVAICLQK